MLKIFPEVEDIENIKKIREVVFEINGNTEGEFYHLEYKGQVSYLHRMNNTFTLFSYEREHLNYKQFTIDKDYHVKSINLNQHTIYLDKNSFWIVDENGRRLSLTVREKSEEYEDEEDNAYVSFSQYNEKTKETVVITYPYYFSKGCPKKIVSLEGRKPIEIAIKNGGQLKKRYCCYDREYGTLFYTLVAIKDYGLKEFLKNGSYSLEWDCCVKRYLRSFGTDHLSFFPFCHAYREGDLYIMLKNKGFLTDVPDALISFHNVCVSNLGEYYAIVNAFKEIDKEGNILLVFAKKDKE